MPTSKSVTTVDPDICPLCRKPNGCEHHHGGTNKNNCWCHELIIPRQIFTLVPAEALNKACICRHCLIKHGAKEIR